MGERWGTGEERVRIEEARRKIGGDVRVMERMLRVGDEERERGRMLRGEDRDGK